MKKIKVTCDTKDFLPLDELQAFQGNLKRLDEKEYQQLRSKITGDQGFSFPVFVWSDKNSHWILDGHQRVRVLNKLKEEGYSIEKVPVVKIEANSYRAAKEKLLSAASQFGIVERQGLYEFIQENQIEPDYLYENYRLADIDFDKFNKEFYEIPEIPDYGEENKELDEGDFSNFAHTCPKCGFEWDGDKKK